MPVLKRILSKLEVVNAGSEGTIYRSGRFAIKHLKNERFGSENGISFKIGAYVHKIAELLFPGKFIHMAGRFGDLKNRQHISLYQKFDPLTEHFFLHEWKKKNKPGKKKSCPQCSMHIKRIVDNRQIDNLISKFYNAGIPIDYNCYNIGLTKKGPIFIELYPSPKLPSLFDPELAKEQLGRKKYPPDTVRRVKIYLERIETLKKQMEESG